MPQACIFLSGQRINYTRQSRYQFHPGTPVHSQTTPSRMLGGGGKETATLHNHFLSLSPVTTCEEELLSQLCTFSSSSWGRRGGRERPKGKILTKHSKQSQIVKRKYIMGMKLTEMYNHCQERVCVEMF